MIIYGHMIEGQKIRTVNNARISRGIPFPRGIWRKSKQRRSMQIRNRGSLIPCINHSGSLISLHPAYRNPNRLSPRYRLFKSQVRRIHWKTLKFTTGVTILISNYLLESKLPRKLAPKSRAAALRAIRAKTITPARKYKSSEPGNIPPPFRHLFFRSIRKSKKQIIINERKI